MKLDVISCPKCGKQYLPAEIFIPNCVFGKPDLILRNTENEIVDMTGITPDKDETYCCDNCNTTFRISLKMKFTATIDDSIDFSDEYADSMKSRFSVKEF